MNIILWLVFGAIIGWLAGIIMKSKSSLIWNIIFGIVGALLGGFIASLFGFGSLSGEFHFDVVGILISIGGACLVILIAKMLKIGK